MRPRKAKEKPDASQLLNFARDSYLERTSRPIYAIIFLLPFIVFYELGTIFINTDVLNQSQVRVVAFVWLQRFLEYLGFSDKVVWAAVPLAVVVILVAMQLASRKRWRFWLSDMLPMAGECATYAVPLIVLTLLLNTAAMPPETNEQAQMQVAGAVICSTVTAESLTATEENGGGQVRGESVLAKVVTGIGAGIYEELIFRLILICVLMLVFQDVLRFNHRHSIILSVIVSAAMFSLHHHVDFLSGQVNHRDVFNWTKFCFRTIAGVYFAILFAIRGFGITAGTHAFYDIIAVVINARFFSQ